MQYADYFKGKKVTVMGLGLLGRGVGDTLFLAEAGAEVIVTDLKTKEQLASSVVLLEKFSNVTFVLGEHKFEDFENRDFILVAAGVPADSPYLAHAKEKEVALEMSAAIFARVSQIPIIGVTGTRGKSTVTAMIHHVLSIVTGEPILLGGNVRGVSNLQLLNDVTPDSLAVFELDSWQLQGFGWAQISPAIAVFTNFMPDHQNYYIKYDHSTTSSPSEAEYVAGMDAYFADKAQIFLHQEDHDVLVTTPTVFEQAKVLALKEDITLGQEVVLADASVLPEDLELRVPGMHNRQNAALAYEALKALSLSDEEICNGLATFPGVPGRLEYVTEIKGVKIYNDNNATTPQATIAALTALGDAQDKKVVLIAGGAYKDIDPAPLIGVIETFCKSLILTSGNGTEKLQEAGANSDLYKAIQIEAVDLTDAVAQAFATAEQGDIILFSPAFSSFAQYQNEYERNDAFMDILETYE